MAILTHGEGVHMRKVCFVCILLSGTIAPIPAAEFLMFDRTFTTTEGDHGFYFFPPDDANGGNWASPDDYYNGRWETRYEIMDYPTSEPFMLSTCIWQDGISRETCSGQHAITGTGVFTQSSVPSSWWKKDAPVEFSRVSAFNHIGLVLWCANWQNCSDWVSGCWNEHNKFLPLHMRLTIVLVSAGSTFSGWDNYAGGGAVGVEDRPARSVSTQEEITGIHITDISGKTVRLIKAGTMVPAGHAVEGLAKGVYLVRFVSDKIRSPMTLKVYR
jgi:hypothetical protein